jgi:hypothetical protein
MRVETGWCMRYSFQMYFRQFIDDVLGIWIPPSNTNANTAWLAFKASLPFGILAWESEDLTNSVNFLDLTIEIRHDYRLKTWMLQKAMNVYLYLCQSSSHPLGVLKDLIFGSIHHFWLQNSNPTDYQNVISDFYQHLCTHGHNLEQLCPLFNESAKCVNSNPLKKLPRAQSSINTPRAWPLFFHIQYQPLELPNSIIHEMFNSCCPMLRDELQVDIIIIAHSRQPNLWDKLCQTQLTEPEGNWASTILSTSLDDS